MRFEINICLLSVLSIITQISDSSQSATNGLQTTDLDQPVLKDGLTTVNDSDSTNGRISKMLQCFVNLSDKGSEATRNECHDAFSSIWISARHLLLGDDNEIGESKKSKKKQWDLQTLMLGAGVKLILFLPVLAVLTGKAISLSLTSLLITSLGFLYRNQLDSFARRNDSV
ncbi:uncharacterized protein LOC132921348 isoform X2 [Rhopalosiphum padi]|uniref:uncharacterized protein LOC132921348 isoform X2 n=1 Tax=Rhopalosiphum padi TaxID=40932 RepID=UPI00298E8A56|nr:uncharacterized protein LOC132921348 isoform X2 [Rhopalosiphum padi]